MTRDEAIDVGTEALMDWHDEAHGPVCCCPMRENEWSRAVVDALIAAEVTL